MATDTRASSKGRVTKVLVSRTRQVENYEPVRVELESTVGEHEEVEDVYDYLRGLADYLLHKDDSPKRS